MQMMTKERFLMDSQEFVRGKRLIDPVTGRVEGGGGGGESSSEENSQRNDGGADADEEDSYEEVERNSYQSKRSRTHDIEMKNVESNSQMSYLSNNSNKNKESSSNNIN